MKLPVFFAITVACLLSGTNAKAYTDSDINDCMQFLYSTMPLPDSTDRTAQFYIDYAVKPALKAREEMSWGAIVPDREFRYFVLPLRINNEALDAHRPIFYDELSDRVKGLSMSEAILEINHWCHEHATYQPSDGRTHSPLQTMSSAIGRCGEESTFTVAALRAMCIPARQVYTPRWAHTDDNHAWVEAWANGKWHFIGACEPEPVLDCAWFNDPAARGILMHARVPASYSGNDEVLDKTDNTTTINVTANYAPVDTLRIKVIHNDGTPAAGATVTFRVYNYAEFYPIATKTTDVKGEATLISGKGDLLVWASEGPSFGIAKASVGKDKTIELTLDLTAQSEIDVELDMTPPPASKSLVQVTEEQRAENARRLSQEDSMRFAYTSTFAKGDSLMMLSRGNHIALSDFLNTLNTSERVKCIRLLKVLTEKDLTDVSPEVLRDHLKAQDDGTDLFDRYVMSPRIENEELTPFRSDLIDMIGDDRVAMSRNNPQSWVRWVADSISADRNWYPEQATMSPVSVFRHRHTSPKSRDIFFVASMRSMGIPARMDPVNGKPQWNDGEEWRDAIFDNSNLSHDKGSQGFLKYEKENNSNGDNPKYYSHFTISKIENGQPQLLTFPDFAPLATIFASPYKTSAGKYLLVTGQRMADGSVLSRLKSIDVKRDSISTDTVRIRHSNNGIEVIGSFDSENKFMPIGESAPRSILSETGRGYYVLGVLLPGHEPSNHALRDIALLTNEFDELGRKTIVLFDDEAALKRARIEDFSGLPADLRFGWMHGSNVIDEATAANRLTAPDYPMFIIADTFNRVVFASHGYTIGLGQRMVNTLQNLTRNY